MYNQVLSKIKVKIPEDVYEMIQNQAMVMGLITDKEVSNSLKNIKNNIVSYAKKIALNSSLKTLKI